MINSVVLMGRLTHEPELRRTPNDIAVTSFSLAVERPYSSKDGERQTDFIDVDAWRSTAEFICKYFHKGQLVAVEGSIQTRNFTDSQGNKRKSVRVLADRVHFAEGKRDQSAAPMQEFAPVSYSSGSDDDFVDVSSDSDELPF